MSNQDLVNLFYKLAELLESKGVEWKPQAYRKAARSLQALKEDVAKIYKEGGIKGLDEIPGIGKGIAKRIEQYLKTGKISEFEKLKKSEKVDLGQLTEVISMGPKRADYLYKHLGIKTVKDLEKAAKAGKIAKLPTFGETSQKDILESIKFYKQRAQSSRIPLAKALPIAKKIEKRISALKETKRFEIAGSIRRKRDTVRDIDLLAISNKPEVLMNSFTSMPDIQKVLAKGSTKSEVLLKRGIQADLRVIKPESFGAAFLYFTGPKEFNIWMRKIAIRKSYKLSEYGLFNRKTDKLIEGRNEKKIFKLLGIKYLTPEEREKRNTWKNALQK